MRDYRLIRFMQFEICSSVLEKPININILVGPEFNGFFTIRLQSSPLNTVTVVYTIP